MTIISDIVSKLIKDPNYCKEWKELHKKPFKEYYECHITLSCEDYGHKGWTKAAIECLDWKFSCIDGDPDLGKGIKCYATIQYNRKKSIEEVTKLVSEAAKYLRDKGCRVLREKIELVIYDKRHGK